MTLQEAQTKVDSFIKSLTPSHITYSKSPLKLTLGDKQEEQVECHLYQAQGILGSTINQVFKASSINRLLGKIEGEMRDMYQPENLEEMELQQAA